LRQHLPYKNYWQLYECTKIKIRLYILLPQCLILSGLSTIFVVAILLYWCLFSNSITRQTYSRLIKPDFYFWSIRPASSYGTVQINFYVYVKARLPSCKIVKIWSLWIACIIVLCDKLTVKRVHLYLLCCC